MSQDSKELQIAVVEWFESPTQATTLDDPLPTCLWVEITQMRADQMTDREMANAFAAMAADGEMVETSTLTPSNWDDLKASCPKTVRVLQAMH